MFFLKIVYVFIFILFQRQRKIEEGEADLPSTGALLQCLQQSGLDQGEARSQQVNLGPTTWVAGFKYLSHHLLPSCVHISRKLG